MAFVSWTAIILVAFLPDRNPSGDPFPFLHFHGGTGCGLAHKPFFASRASVSIFSNSASLGAYFRYHQH
jgi:hypothetical protein